MVGTSMGAIIASLYAAGYSPDSIPHIANSIDWNGIFANSAKRNSLFVSQKIEPVDYLFEFRLSDRLEPLPPSSLSHGQAIFDLLAPLLAPAEFRARMDFDSLPVSLRIVATDILSGPKGGVLARQYPGRDPRVLQRPPGILSGKQRRHAAHGRRPRGEHSGRRRERRTPEGHRGDRRHLTALAGKRPR